MSCGPWTTVGHAFRRTALPLICYYAVTLVVPLANGAAQGGSFVGHALVVLVVPPVAIVLACTVHAGLKTTQRYLNVTDEELRRTWHEKRCYSLKPYKDRWGLQKARQEAYTRFGRPGSK